jgi:small subunit ribosomal protein S8
MIDPIADMLTRIRNAQAVNKPVLSMPMSKIKLNISKIIEKEGWISKSEVVKASGQKNQASQFDELRLTLKYDQKGQGAIRSIKRISKPGLRVYVNKENLPFVLNNFGIAIISTSAGLMTNKEARRKGLGGEVLCEIY